MPTYAMKSVCKLSKSNVAFSWVKKWRRGKTNTNINNDMMKHDHVFNLELDLHSQLM